MSERQTVTLKELQIEFEELQTDVQGLALALERLRRAGDCLLVAVNQDAGSFDSAMRGFEDALRTARVGDGAHLEWAADVLDGRTARRRNIKRPRPETFEEVRQKARACNIYVHHVHTFDGSEFAIYRGRLKVRHATNERLCIIALRQLMRTTPK